MTFVALSRRVIKPSAIHRRNLGVPPKAQRRGGTGCPQQQRRSGGIRESVLDGGRHRRLSRSKSKQPFGVRLRGITVATPRASSSARSRRRRGPCPGKRRTGHPSRSFRLTGARGLIESCRDQAARRYLPDAASLARMTFGAPTVGVLRLGA